MGAFALFLGLLLAVPLFFAFVGMFITGVIIILVSVIIFILIHKCNQKRIKKDKQTFKKLKLVPLFMLILGFVLCCPLSSIVINIEKEMKAEYELKGKLYVAAEYQQYDKVKKLLDKGYEPDYAANYFRTPLSVACENQDNKMV